jgi:hypothetical protein
MADAGEQWAVVYQPLQELKTEGPWETRRAEFVEKLPDAQAPAIEAFLTHLDELPEEQRADLLRTEEADTVMYGYLEEYSDSSSESEESGESEEEYAESEETSESAIPEHDGTWAGFIAVNVPYWDGEEDTWDTFREWFVYHAAEAGFGDESAALFAELDTQDIDSRIATFGRNGGTTTRRGGRGGGAGGKRGGKAGTGNTGLVGIGKPEHTGGTREKSARLQAKVRKAVAQPPTLTVTIQREGVLTQVLAQAQNIGFHMYATLTTPQGTPSAITALYELRQYVRDAFNRGGPNVQALSPWGIDGPFQPPYQGGISTVNNNNIQFDDHPGFTTNAQIAANEWLHSYQVDFYWVVTRLRDNTTWTSPAVSNTVTSVYNGGANAPVAYVTGGNHAWNVDNFV